MDPLLLILDSAQNSSDNSQTVNHPPLLAVLVSSYHLRRRATSKQTTMSFAVIIITIVVIVVSFFISQLRSMKPFRFLQSAGSNRVELSLVTTSSYMDIITSSVISPMICSCEYCHSTRQKMPYPQAFYPKGGVLFGL